MLKSQFQQITGKLPHSHHHLLHPNHHHSHRLFLSPSLNFSHAPLALRRTRPCPTVVVSAAEDDGPVQLFQPTDPIFSTDDDASPIQVATSVLLTGAISIFLFRSLRRRARRAKELQFRSAGVKKSIQEEAMETLKAMAPSTPSGESKGPPSPVQAFLGAVSAGVIALILYKFATTVETSLNRQTISDNFSVRQITITVRTIINGLCYLATFVFGLNSLGLFLYAGQLAIRSISEEPKGDQTPTKDEETLTAETPSNKTDDKENQSSDNSQ